MFKYGINDFYITDANNRNILPGNIKIDNYWNKYLMISHFKKYSRALFNLCNDAWNDQS